MISVVIPLYNKEKSIVNTLNTVLGQTFQDFEIVLVNDGSTDNSVEEAEKVQDDRIRIIHQQNAGVSAARNRGIEEAKYDLIAFLDADDEWKPEYLEMQYRMYAKYPECSVFACNYEFQDQTGKVTSTIIKNIPFDGEDGILTNYFEVASYSHPPLWTSAVVVRKDAIKAAGGFPVGIKSGEDLLTWARLAADFKIAYSRLNLAVFNVEGYSVSERPKRVPAEVDVVGEELDAIYRKKHPYKMRRYISHWHKMRSSIYMRLKRRKLSINEALVGLGYYPLNLKLYIYIIINLLPDFLNPVK